MRPPATWKDGRAFYDIHEPGAGEYFVDSLLSDIESLGLFHGIHPVHHGFHRMLSKRFPFGVYYCERELQTEVFAVLNFRRNPNWIRKDLGRR